MTLIQGSSAPIYSPAPAQSVSNVPYIGAQLSQVQEPFQLLCEAFRRFQDVHSLRGGDTWEQGKNAQRELQSVLQDAGICGPQALALLEQHRALLAWEAMDVTTFTSFYRFVFLICKDPGRRFMPTDRALYVWGLLLPGRFRLLSQWCCFVQQLGKASIPEDTWRQVLDFSRSVHEDLSNYDPNGAWPVVVDQFVEYLREERGRPLLRSISSQQLVPGSFPSAVLPPLSPTAGSKRRYCSAADVDTVASQLESMPAPSWGLGEEEGASSAAKRRFKVARQ